MATNCLVALAEEIKQQFPNVSKVIQQDFYMDDLMSGADTVEECCKLQQTISEVLNSINFPLRKWCSNSSDVLKNIGS